VSDLHFKSVMIEEELAQTQDTAVIDKMNKVISDVTALLKINDQYRLEDDADVQDTHHHHHVTLKSSCPTHWNSSLSMIKSILDMKREVMNPMKRNRKVDTCLDTNEIELLEELRNFLKPLPSFTELVSTATAMVSLVPLIKLQIRKMCSVSNAVIDSPPMKTVNKKILEKLDYRLPATAPRAAESGRSYQFCAVL